MQTLNTIPSNGTYGSAIGDINTNFSLVRLAIGEVELNTRKNKGLFFSVSSLESSIPTPEVGDWALVGTSLPAALYACTEAGRWEDTGSTYGDSITLNDYATQSSVDLLDSKLTALQGLVGEHTVQLGELSEALESLDGVVLTRDTDDPEPMDFSGDPAPVEGVILARPSDDPEPVTFGGVTLCVLTESEAESLSDPDPDTIYAIVADE
jgi:hypothetical protein